MVVFNTKGIEMLALTRRPGETVHIGDGITVTVVEVRGDKVRLAFGAPHDVRIMRGELLEEQEGGEA